MPRLPEHCIEYARILQWPKDKPFGGKSSSFNFSTSNNFQHKSLRPQPSSQLETSLDGDNPEHIQWVFERAQERATEFSITGVTYRLTQGEHAN